MSNLASIPPFLTKLSQNNNRDWFQAHREEYDVVRTHFVQLVAAVLSEMLQFDPFLFGVEPKRTLFRINRDIRFSKNKLPYNSHFSAAIAPGGRKWTMPGFYLRINADGQLAMAAGEFEPQSAKLRQIRESIAEDSAPLRTIIQAKKFKQYFGTLSGSEVKTAPRGFSTDHPDIDLLRKKSFVVFTEESIAEHTIESLLPIVIQHYTAAKPLVDWVRKVEGLV